MQTTFTDLNAGEDFSTGNSDRRKATATQTFTNLNAGEDFSTGDSDCRKHDAIKYLPTSMQVKISPWRTQTVGSLQQLNTYQSQCR